MEHQVLYATVKIGKAKQTRTIQALLITKLMICWILQQQDLGRFLQEGNTTATAIKEYYLKKLFNELCFDHLHEGAMAICTEGQMNSFRVQLHEDVNIDHLYCADHNIQMTAKFDWDDKYFGFDSAGNPCKLIQKFKAVIDHYSSYSIHRQLRTLQKTQSCWDNI
jgi:hypothetical protein